MLQELAVEFSFIAAEGKHHGLAVRAAFCMGTEGLGCREILCRVSHHGGVVGQPKVLDSGAGGQRRIQEVITNAAEQLLDNNNSKEGRSPLRRLS